MNGVTILFVYAAIMILATVILTKKEKNVERFCVGSRSENWLMSALSIAARQPPSFAIRNHKLLLKVQDWALCCHL